MQNNLLTDIMDTFDDRIDQDHIPLANLSASCQFAASLKLINDEYTYGHEKNNRQVLLWWVSIQNDLLNIATRLLHITIQRSRFSMTSQESYFRQKKYGLVGTSSSRPWRPLPSIMDLQFALRKRPFCATGTARTRPLVHT